MKTQGVDYLVVGQGLAGTWLAHYLLQNGKKILLVDQHNPNSATNVAAGIVNPITGRKLVKSWLFDSLLPFAKIAYRQAETDLQAHFFEEAPIVWLLNDVAEINAFAMRSTDPGYKKYILGVKKDGIGGGFKEFKAHAIVTGARAYLARFVAAYRKRLLQHNLLINDRFEHKQIELHPSGVMWRNIHAKKIIFCEGFTALENPFFNWAPITPAKGQVLLIRAPKLNTNGALVKRKQFICPAGKDLFWVGSNYNRNFINLLPNVAERDRLTAKLEQAIAVSYEIVEHKAAVRPTTLHRRPFMGLHPKHPQLGIFNGLGTKGVTLAPFFATHFVDHLLNATPLMKEVNIEQYWTS